MNDLISRQAAIAAFDTNLNELVVGGEKNAKTVENYLNGVLNKIKCLPYAEPKKGKWNRLDMDTLNCNKCGATFVLNQGSEKMHFCPNCGADMKEVTT